MSKISEQINEYEAETQSELAKQKYARRSYYYNSFHYSMTWKFYYRIFIHSVSSDFCNKMLDELSFFVSHTGKIRSLQLQLNHTKSTCSKMNRTIAQLRSDVNDKMVKKFGMKIDFDEMEEAVLTRLLMNQPKVDDAAAKHREKELRKLEVIY